MLPRDLVHAAMVVQVAAKPGLFYGRPWRKKPREATRESRDRRHLTAEQDASRCQGYLRQTSTRRQKEVKSIGIRCIEAWRITRAATQALSKEGTTRASIERYAKETLFHFQQ
jgi:hypothetical protein